MAWCCAALLEGGQAHCGARGLVAGAVTGFGLLGLVGAAAAFIVGPNEQDVRELQAARVGVADALNAVEPPGSPDGT